MKNFLPHTPLALIFAMASNRGISKDGALPWNIPEDLKQFKLITNGHALIMGRKTHESIGRPLPQRRNIILTHSSRAFAGCETASSLDEAIAMARRTDAMPMIIGGAQVYEQALPFATRLYMTRIEYAVDADTFFPEVDFSHWQEKVRKPITHNVTFIELARS